MQAVKLFDRVLDSLTPAFEALTHVFYVMSWFTYAIELGRCEQMNALLVKASATWATADKTMDSLCEHVASLRSRGDQTMGQHIITVEFAAWMSKMGFILTAAPEASGVSAEVIMDQLPSVRPMFCMYVSKLGY